MTLNDVIFIDSFPKLDLHGFDRETARVAILDFIRDHKRMKNPIVVIVHGRGSGILRETTHSVLKKSKDIVAFKSYYYNDGCVIVQISLEK